MIDNRVLADPDSPSGVVVRAGGAEQSYVDPDDPTRLEFDYVRRIADLLDLHHPAGERMRVVHLGGAGMTLPRYVAHTRPTSPQIVLEPDASLVAEVRETIPLPKRSGIKVRETDGRSGVAAMPDAYAEVVILDAFVERRVPAELTTAEFFDDVRRVLTTQGVFILNISDTTPFGYAKRVLAGLAERWSTLVIGAEPATLKGRRFGNVTVAASGAGIDEAGLRRRAAGSASPYRVMVGAEVVRWIANAAPLTDADSRLSPEPPQGLTVF